MIQIGTHYISDDVSDIICELKQQLKFNGLDRFYKTVDTPNNLMVCCPFHKEGQERKPSMGILKTDGTCHCFTCGWVGSLPEMISNCFGYDDLGRFGTKWLIKNFLTIELEERQDVEIDCSRGDNANIDNLDNKNYVSEDELDSYRWTHSYWKDRGIVDKNIIELFDLGYDKDTACVTFPVRDKSGNCLFVARRSVKTKYFNYPPGVEKPLYGLYELCNWGNYNVSMNVGSIREVVVCESMIDCILLWQAGKFAVALNGLGNDLQFKQLKELPCRHLILATDNDEAGMQARQRIAKNVHNKIMTQYVLPQNKKDIGECTLDEINNLREIFI